MPSFKFDPNIKGFIAGFSEVKDGVMMESKRKERQCD